MSNWSQITGYYPHTEGIIAPGRGGADMRKKGGLPAKIISKWRYIVFASFDVVRRVGTIGTSAGH
eukprot:1339107-Amorphochlora_amoeboformis.AAC.1